MSPDRTKGPLEEKVSSKWGALVYGKDPSAQVDSVMGFITALPTLPDT